MKAKSVQYQCEKCKSIVQSETLPDDKSCPTGDNHKWIDLDRRKAVITRLYILIATLLGIGLAIMWFGFFKEIRSDFQEGNWATGLGFGCWFAAVICYIILRRRQSAIEKRKPDNKRAIIVTASGVVIILISIIVLIYSHQVDINTRPIYFSFLTFIIRFTQDAGIAVLSAGIITIIIEVRSFVEFTAKSVIEALTSDSYLDGLTEERLQEIKTACSRKIIEAKHNRTESNLNESLLDLEAAVSKQLFMPYYEKYRIRVECEEVNAQEKGFTISGKLLEKRIHTVYTIVNPKQGMEEEKLDLKYNMARPERMFAASGEVTEDIRNLIRIEKFLITIDNAEQPINVIKKVKYKFEIKQAAQVIKYDVIAKLVKNNSPKEDGGDTTKKEKIDPSEEEYVVHYDNKLVIDMTEVIYVPIDDELYARRLTKPTKYSSIFYQYKQPKDREIKLQAACFCTLKDYYKSVTTNEGSSYVEVICDNWLLPWNGFCIIHMPVVQAGEESS